MFPFFRYFLKIRILTLEFTCQARKSFKKQFVQIKLTMKHLLLRLSFDFLQLMCVLNTFSFCVAALSPKLLEFFIRGLKNFDDHISFLYRF